MKKNFIPVRFYKKIIHLLPLCCVDLVIKKGDFFLMIKRKENPAKNKWWFAGGRILFNEKILSAVKRKLKEELKIKKVKKIKFLGVGETKFKKGLFGKPVHTINNVFLIEINQKESERIRPDSTIVEYRWFNKIQKNFHPYLKNFLKLAGF